MKIELVKKTTAVFGDEYYYITIDGLMAPSTWTTSKEYAEEKLAEIIEKAKLFPEDKYEVLFSNETEA